MNNKNNGNDNNDSGKDVEVRLKQGMPGKSKNKFMIMDFVTECPKWECNISDFCPYWDRDPNVREGGCKIERMYLDAVTKPFIELMEKANSPFVIQWVGLHLIPLYHSLIKLQKEEIAMANNSGITMIDRAGKPWVNPIYREIREVINAINKQWKEGLIYDIAKQVGMIGAIGEGMANGAMQLRELEMNGISGFYEAMSGDSNEGKEKK